MDCYDWELKAILTGCAKGQLDERERLAVLAANIGYFSNDKKPRYKKIMNKKKEEHSIDKAFEDGIEYHQPDKSKMLNALNYFAKKEG